MADALAYCFKEALFSGGQETNLENLHRLGELVSMMCVCAHVQHISSTSIKELCWRGTVMGAQSQRDSKGDEWWNSLPQQDSDVRKKGRGPWRLGHLQEVKARGLGV